MSFSLFDEQVDPQTITNKNGLNYCAAITDICAVVPQILKLYSGFFFTCSVKYYQVCLVWGKKQDEKGKRWSVKGLLLSL